MMNSPNGWVHDLLLPNYQMRQWPIAGAQFASGEPVDRQLTATLIRRNAPSSRRALLYIHGWNDYFFQTNLADFWASLGYDFYALELRRYGRNLVPGLFAGYISDLRDYFTEIDDAVVQIQEEGHNQLVLMAHSTGGLIASLWANEAPHQLSGLILNSPWLDMTGSASMWRALSALVSGVAYASPTTAMQNSGPNHYYESIIRTGNWGIDTNYKANDAFVLRFGWGKAILSGQAQVALGLNIDAPVLSIMSTRSISPSQAWQDDYLSADIVLDVERLAAASVHLGRLVTIARVSEGMHDLALSRTKPREEFFEYIRQWQRTYLAEH